MKHIHHIIPKHMGGTDDPSNLVELTVEQHAEAHRQLYEQYGRLEDKRAWLGLAGIMSGEEIIKEILTSPKTEDWKEKNRKPKRNKSNYFGNTNGKGNLGKPKSEEHKQKIRDSHTGKKREPFSDEWKKALKDAKQRQLIRQCPHCNLEGRGPNMNRYHFDNCKRRL